MNTEFDLRSLEDIEDFIERYTTYESEVEPKVRNDHIEYPSHITRINRDNISESNIVRSE